MQIYICALGAVAFVLFGIWNYFVTDRIAAILARGFPEVYSQVRADSWPAKLKTLTAAMSTFVWKRRDRELGHAGITKLTVLSLCLNWMTWLSWGVFAVGGFYAMHSR